MGRLTALSAAASLVLLWTAGGCRNGETAQDDDLRRRVQELTAALESARLELFNLRLRQARDENKPDVEAKLLREDGLRSPSDAVRAQAVREIAALPSEQLRPYLEDVAACARGGAPAVRAEALALLARSPGAEPVLIEAARDPSPEVRRAAALALKPDWPSTAEALVELIGDPSREVRLAALETARGVAHERVVAAVIAAATESGDTAVAEKAVDILGARASADAAGPLLAILASTRSDSIRWSCINALGKIGAPESAAAVRPYLSREQPTNLRDIAAQALGKLRDAQSAAALADALAKDPEERVRAAAARALGLIGGPSLLRETLLPAALNEGTAAVQQAAWEACIEAAGRRCADLLFLADTMLDHGRRTDVEAVCLRIRDLKPQGAERELALKLEERVADAAIAAQDYRAGATHLEVLRAVRPGQGALLRKLARCHRELADHDAAQKALGEALLAAEAGSPLYWELRLELLAEFEALGAHARIIGEFAPAADASPPDAARAAIDAARARAADALIRELVSADPASRTRALESVKPLSKNFIETLADAVTDASLPDRSAILEAGNAIAGTTFTDLTKAAEIAAAWRAWSQK